MIDWLIGHDGHVTDDVTWFRPEDILGKLGKSYLSNQLSNSLRVWFYGRVSVVSGSSAATSCM